MTDVDEIRRRMAQIRRDMHYDVSHVVGDVEGVMDWRAAARRHPYVLIGVGMAAGYLLVPRRHDPVQWVEPVAMEVQPLGGPPTPPPEKPPKSLARRAAGWTAGMLWPLVSQSAQDYAAAWLDNQIKQHMRAEPSEGPSPASPSGPEESGGDDYVYRMPRRG